MSRRAVTFKPVVVLVMRIKLQGLLITVQRLGFPVFADLAEQSMLDRIPFGSAGWVVRNGDAQSQAIAQLPLNFLLLGAALCPMATASVGQDEDVAGLRIALVSFDLPPLAKAGDGPGGCFVGSSQGHTAASWAGYRRCHTEW